MTKNQMIEEIRRVVIMACYPGKTYEAALIQGRFSVEEEIDQRIVRTCNCCRVADTSVRITIGRLMAAMKKKTYEDFLRNQESDGSEIGAPDFAGMMMFLSRGWQLLREDGSEAVLEDQTIETLQKIYSLICK